MSKGITLYSSCVQKTTAPMQNSINDESYLKFKKKIKQKTKKPKQNMTVFLICKSEMLHFLKPFFFF